MEELVLEVLKTGSVAAILGLVWWLERKERIDTQKLLYQSYKDNATIAKGVEDALNELTDVIKAGKK